MIKLTTIQAAKLLLTKKSFVFFDVDRENKAINLKLTNDYIRYKNHYSNFRVISTIESKLKYINL